MASFWKTSLVSLCFLSLVLLIVVYVWGQGELYFSPYPQISTRYSTGYVESVFLTITPGLTESQVEAKLGTPLWNIPKDGGTVEWGYTQDKEMRFVDFAWLVRKVVFSNGTVVATVKRVAYD